MNEESDVKVVEKPVDKVSRVRELAEMLKEWNFKVASDMPEVNKA